ncbi:MAG: YbaB/EbfC family nucleoid-associated protein [Pirellulaceae bacterium]|nr:YbaB/EbfC family nucleoid-associated protein [Pirellulaceae bacterium]
MFKGIGNLASMFRNMQDMGGKMEQITETLKSARVTGAAGGELVKVEANGLGQVLKISIDQVLREDADWEMIQDLLVAAFNDVTTKAKEKHVAAMSELTGGFDLPGLGDALNRMGMGPGPSGS